MADLVVVVPSRGRPTAATELATAFAETCTADTLLTFAVDTDDPTLDQYGPGRLTIGSHQSMVDALNQTVRGHVDLGQGLAPFAVAFMGDDHRPRTKGWDQAYLDALRELGTGIVYGDDLLQGERLPTQCAMTSDIVRALGYMAPSSLTHMYVDNFWLGLGRSAGCICYLPDVVVEHLHPLADKAEWDDGYQRVNHRSMYEVDQNAYLGYCASQLADDVAKVNSLRGARVGS